MTTIRSVTVGIPVGDLNAAIAWYRQLVEKGEELEPAPGVWEHEVMPSVWLQLFEQVPDGTSPASCDSRHRASRQAMTTSHASAPMLGPSSACQAPSDTSSSKIRLATSSPTTSS